MLAYSPLGMGGLTFISVDFYFIFYFVLGVGMLAYSPLGMGRLTGKYSKNNKVLFFFGYFFFNPKPAPRSTKFCFFCKFPSMKSQTKI